MVPQGGVLLGKQRGTRDSLILSFFLSFSLTHILTCACLGGKIGEHCKMCKKNQPGYFLFSSPNLKNDEQNNLK